VLYLLALHRLLKLRLPDYDYDRHVGGALYLFLRGSQSPSRGIHAERPPRALIEALDHLFARRRPGGRMNPLLPTPPRPWPCSTAGPHGWLRALDAAFAAFLAREAPDAPPLLILAAALASHQLGRGHACLDLADTLADPGFALSLPPRARRRRPAAAAGRGAGGLDLPAGRRRWHPLGGDGPAHAAGAWAGGSTCAATGNTNNRCGPASSAPGRPGRPPTCRRCPAALDALFPPAATGPTGRSSPARWPRAAPSPSSPAAPAPARPPPWCACWRCCRPWPGRRRTCPAHPPGGAHRQGRGAAQRIHRRRCQARPGGLPDGEACARRSPEVTTLHRLLGSRPDTATSATTPATRCRWMCWWMRRRWSTWR
jgi:hypothetical protein